jgi:hypothetical protein
MQVQRLITDNSYYCVLVCIISTQNSTSRIQFKIILAAWGPKEKITNKRLHSVIDMTYDEHKFTTRHISI